MSYGNLKSILGSVLFAYGEAIGIDKLAKITKAKKEEIEAALKELKEEYSDRGLTILEKSGEYQLGSSPDNSKYIEDLVRGEFTEELSRAALEVVSIVAYRGPISRTQIEYVRGVNSTFTLRNLLMRGLVERVENPKDARSYLYRISFDFLKHLGIARPEDLPQYGDLRKEKIEILEEPVEAA